MVDKTSKLIGNKVAGGDFDDLVKLLEKNPDDLSKKQAIYFIICCCTTCNANINSHEVLDERDLIICIKSLARKIVEVSSGEFDKYLQSIFYICKLLLKKDFKLVLQLEREILPPFIPKTLTETQKGTFKSICQLIKLETLNANQTVDINSIISIGRLMSNILKTSTNHAIFSEIIFGFGSSFTRLNVDIKDQFEFFLHNWEQFKRFNDSDRSRGIMHYIKCGMFIFIAFIKNGALNEAKSCFSKVMDGIPNVEECAVFKEILKICEFMLDSSTNVSELLKYKENLVKSMKFYGNNDSMRNLCKTVALAVYGYSFYCKNTDSSNFFVNLDLHQNFYEIIQKIMAFLTYYLKTCEFGKCVCSTTKGIPEGVYLVVSILNFYSAFVTKHDVPSESIQKIVSYLEKFSKFLVTLKKNNCDNWDNYWSELLRYVYNLAILVYKKEKYEETLTISHMILKYHSLLGNLEDEEVLPNTMSLLNVTYLKQNKFTQALLWTSVEILNTKQTSRHKIFANIIKVKVSARDNNNTSIQEQNVCTILDEIPKEYKCYLRDILINVEFQIELLVSELEVYDRKWKSKIPMLGAFRNLCKIAENNVLIDVFVRIFSSWELNMHEDMEQLLENVFKNYKLTKNTKHRVFVHYFRYKMQTQKIITKNIQEMNKTVKAREASSHAVDIMGSEADDKCDVVSVYEGLRIDGEKMDLLKKCLNDLEQLVESKIHDVDLEKLYTISNNVAFEFNLHSDVYNFLKALYLGLKIAKRLGNNNYLLESSGFIIKHTSNAELEKAMKKIIKTSQLEAEYLIQYYVNLSYSYFNNLNEAVKYLNNAVECLKCSQNECGKRFWYVEAIVELLTFEIMQINGNGFGLGFSYKPLLKAYGIIVDKYTTEPEWKPRHFALFFKVFETLIKTYHDLKMPREVRCYGKQTLQIAQQHSIPVESTKALNYLAHADYRSGRLDDFRVKLDGISQILQMENVRKIQTKRHEKPVVPTINVITEGIRDVNLECNVKLSSSPTFIGESYQEPAFSYHENCECFQCTSVEYHELVVARLHLEALWYTHLKQVTLANSFYKGTLNFSRILSKKQVIIPRKLRETTNSRLEHSINRWHYSCSVDYVKFLHVCATPEAAEKHNTDLIKRVESQKTYHANVYAEILLQKLKFLHKIKRIKTELSVPKPEYAACKTPETNRAAKVVKIATNSPKIKTFYAPKLIKFNLDEENKQTPKTPKNTKILPPSLRAAKTPLLKTPKELRMPLSEVVSDKATDVKIKDNLLDIKAEKLSVKTRKTSTSTRKKLDLNTARIEDDRNKRATRRNRT